ncbi:hypothetical protein GOBAR_AA24127 [Gossypium barbadense]|uniref:Uncharacterized protein n=1 Tax=Gossypium barbadense TaxID=3634 RepID=A0A2P5WZM8_GOSBA|nr:hypothetical protein GOBAR_AA24127 [Gossypium barbadense]
MILEARGKPILTMIETIRTKIMLLIVKKKEEADKWKGMLCPKIKKKLDVNIKDSLRCVPPHAGEEKYQVECGPGSQHVFPETYVQTWYTKQTQLQIYSNFISPVKGPKQWASLSNMLPILPPTLGRPLGKPTKVKRHKVGVPTQQQATPNQQESTPTQQAASTQLPSAPTHQQAALREKLPFKRRPTTVRWMPPTQGSSMIDH